MNDRVHRLAAGLLLAAMSATIGGCGPVLPSERAVGDPETVDTVTADGWTIQLRHYRAVQPDGTRLPVVLCHGLSYNDRFWDLRDDVSLARFLAARGYDVWVPALRGAGGSTKPPIHRLRQLFRANLYSGIAGAVRGQGRGLLRVNWTVDDHVAHDVPAILDLVTQRTGQPAVHWVGHSMGGMILEGHLARRPDGADPRVRSFVALAVPVFVLEPRSEPMELLAREQTPVAISNALVSTSLPALLNVIGGGTLRTPIDALFYNERNLDPNVIRLLSAVGTEDIAPGQFAQLTDMVRTGRFRSADATLDYTEPLPRVRTDALWIAGTVDNLATVAAVQQAYRRWGAARKQYALFGRVNGHAEDYGHDDLALGRRAREEVYPRILAWLEEYRDVTAAQRLLETPARVIGR